MTAVIMQNQVYTFSAEDMLSQMEAPDTVGETALQRRRTQMREAQRKHRRKRQEAIGELEARTAYLQDQLRRAEQDNIALVDTLRSALDKVEALSLSFQGSDGSFNEQVANICQLLASALPPHPPPQPIMHINTTGLPPPPPPHNINSCTPSPQHPHMNSGAPPYDNPFGIVPGKPTSEPLEHLLPPTPVAIPFSPPTTCSDSDNLIVSGTQDPSVYSTSWVMSMPPFPPSLESPMPPCCSMAPFSPASIDYPPLLNVGVPPTSRNEIPVQHSPGGIVSWTPQIHNRHSSC